MSSQATPLPKSEHVPFTKIQSVGLVFLCTIIGAAAQVFMKIGGQRLQHFEIARIISDVPLIAGYSLYGLNMLLLMFALRDGELSMLYPVIALTYAWVTILSVFLFHETMTPWKVIGIFTIVSAVAILGRAGSR